jgi:hypothetical protein
LNPRDPLIVGDDFTNIFEQLFERKSNKQLFYAKVKVNFFRNEIGTKAGHKMLVKLTKEMYNFGDCLQTSTSDLSGILCHSIEGQERP